MLTVLPDNETLDKQDWDVQHACSDAIVKASEDGQLLGKEAPTYRCHTFAPVEDGAVYAQALTRQLNHFAEALGVLGFQVNYRTERKASDSPQPETAYFEVRVFARAND